MRLKNLGFILSLYILPLLLVICVTLTKLFDLLMSLFLQLSNGERYIYQSDCSQENNIYFVSGLLFIIVVPASSSKITTLYLFRNLF